VTDTLDRETVTPLLRGRFGSPYLYAVSCPSTQGLLGPDLPEGAVGVCERQTAGRGRLGRRWEAPLGSAILCSVLLRPPGGRRPAELTLVAGLATARTVEQALRRPCGIKWPNDVLVGGRKVAGVLGEARGGAVVLGIGLNVNQETASLPAAARTPPASLFTIDGVRRPRAPILAGLLAELEELYGRWREDGLSRLSAELAERDVLRGRRVAVGGTSGIAVGITVEGRLEIDTGGGRCFVASGEVSLELPSRGSLSPAGTGHPD
jgi:BirA family biotin operon repressor/biotin-[acetyl-CoA-carboxylase] ligase